MSETIQHFESIGIILCLIGIIVLQVKSFRREKERETWMKQDREKSKNEKNRPS